MATPMPPGVELRQATDADNHSILEFLADHAMPGALQMRFDRSPDFFALARSHSDEVECWLLLHNGQIIGLATLIVRDGFVNGRREPVMYLGDLRVARSRRAVGLWHRLFAERLGVLRQSRGLRYGYCAIIRSNRLALNTLVAKRRDGNVEFQHLRGYASVSLIGRKPAGRSPAAAYAVRRATADDIEILADFLCEEGRRQVFGVCFDTDLLDRRLQEWPGLNLRDFHLAFDGDGALVGCVAPWDASPLKRIVIDSLPFAAEWLRRLANLAAPLTRRARIPRPPGAVLADISLTHLAIRDRDPEIFSALLDSAWHSIVGERRAATVSVCLFDDDPLWPALRRYWHYAVPMDLYWVRSEPDVAELPNAGATPGFEMYLV